MVIALAALIGSSASADAPDSLSSLKHAIERSTLDQSGTKPFHLKAIISPGRRAKPASSHTGSVEIWWVSPAQWRREIHTPEFSQVAIVNGSDQWQKNEGDYFPEWLREIAAALVDPVPSLDVVLQQANSGEVRHLFGTTEYSWVNASSDGNVQKIMGAGIQISDKNGLIANGTSLGWSAEFADYRNFHDRMVARTVTGGSLEDQARVVTLEDLGRVPPGFFDAKAPGGDAQLLQTLIVSETSFRTHLLAVQPVVWPSLKDGPLQGVLTTEVVVDRTGKVRNVGTIVSDNPGVDDTARQAIASMQFKPYLSNGVPVQVLSRITMPFKTVRPPGVETFSSARDYFEIGRKLDFLAAGNGPPYVLRAMFLVKASSGALVDGQYVDTWMGADQWRREASMGESRFVRSQRGEKTYLLSEGPDAGLLLMVLRILEPIPALDTFVESDWRIRRDIVGGVSTIRVLSGYESPDGTLDPEQARGFWFDDSGNLVKAYFEGLEIQRSNFQSYDGVRVARQINVLRNGIQAMTIHVTDILPAGTVDPSIFEIPGHEWVRDFTSEMR